MIEQRFRGDILATPSRMGSEMLIAASSCKIVSLPRPVFAQRIVHRADRPLPSDRSSVCLSEKQHTFSSSSERKYEPVVGLDRPARGCWLFLVWTFFVFRSDMTSSHLAALLFLVTESVRFYATGRRECQGRTPGEASTPINRAGSSSIRR